MKKKDVKIGMKVVPFKKTVPGYMGLEESIEWCQAQAQGFMYVTGYNELEKAWELSYEKHKGGHADFFRSSDFRPYEGVRGMKKKDLYVGMKVTPFQKSIGIVNASLESSVHWERALENGHAFLYVVRIDKDKVSLSDIRTDITGDWFLPEDLEKYSWRKHRKLVKP